MFTVSQAATALTLPEYKVRRLIAAKRIKAKKFGRDWIIDDLTVYAPTLKRGRPRKAK